MKTELKNLTRKTLESTLRVQTRRLVAEKMKIDVMVERIKEIIKVVPVLLKHNKAVKNEINGRLRALLVWLDGKSQFQFQKEIEKVDTNVKVSYGNLYWGICGLLLGFFTSNAVHGLLKIWGTGRV